MCFLIFHSNKKIIMPMEGPFKSGILKLKIHMANLVLPERSNLRKCQRRKKSMSGYIASLDTFVKQIFDLVSNKLVLTGSVFSFLFINQLEKNILKSWRWKKLLFIPSLLEFEMERSNARIRQLESQGFFFRYLVTQRSNWFSFPIVSSFS